MMYHANIPNGNYIERITVEGDNYVHAFARARAYIEEGFGAKEAPALVAKWAELASPVESHVVHFGECELC